MWMALRLDENDLIRNKPHIYFLEIFLRGCHGLAKIHNLTLRRSRDSMTAEELVSSGRCVEEYSWPSPVKGVDF